MLLSRIKRAWCYYVHQYGKASPKIKINEAAGLHHISWACSDCGKTWHKFWR